MHWNDSRLISRQLREWIGHMRDSDNRQRCQHEECRLTFDQAMLLCFELSQDDLAGDRKRDRAFAAYQLGRPWDFLRGSHMFAWLVPWTPGRVKVTL
jgi:hypothetical protein